MVVTMRPLSLLGVAGFPSCRGALSLLFRVQCCSACSGRAVPAPRPKVNGTEPLQLRGDTPLTRTLKGKSQSNNTVRKAGISATDVRALAVRRTRPLRVLARSARPTSEEPRQECKEDHDGGANKDRRPAIKRHLPGKEQCFADDDNDCYRECH